MISTPVLSEAFQHALPYPPYLAAAKPHEQANWRGFEARVVLTTTQTELIRSFARRINVLALSGSWCGDCVQQVPILAKIAALKPADPAAGPNSPGIDFRLLERDDAPNAALVESLRICGGNRVPVVLFLNEDLDFVALSGDRLISRYRLIAARQLGASCPLPGAPVPADEIAATTADWVQEFERVALLLRISPKLRARHAD